MDGSHFKDSQVIKGITIGTALILVYLGLNNISGIINTISYCAGLIMPFIVGGVIAFVLNVPMRSIEKLVSKAFAKSDKKYPKLVRLISYLITIFAVAAVIALVLLVVIPELASTISELIKQIPDAVNSLIAWMQAQFEAYPELEKRISEISVNWDSIIKTAIDFLSTGTKGVISGGIGAITSIFSGITTFFIGFVFSIYILFQKEKLTRQFKKIIYVMFSEKRADRIIEVLKLTNSTFSNFLSGQCLEALILGSMFVVSMLLLRLPYAVLIGMIIAVTALVPIVGAFIGCAVGVILIAIDSPVKAVIFVILFLVLQQIEGNLIYPHVVGNSVGLPGIWVLVAVTIGGNLFGIAGMLTFIPISSVCYALFRIYINRKIEEKNIDRIKYENTN